MSDFSMAACVMVKDKVLVDMSCRLGPLREM